MLEICDRWRQLKKMCSNIEISQAIWKQIKREEFDMDMLCNSCRGQWEYDKQGMATYSTCSRSVVCCGKEKDSDLLKSVLSPPEFPPVPVLPLSPASLSFNVYIKVMATMTTATHAKISAIKLTASATYVALLVLGALDLRAMISSKNDP